MQGLGQGASFADDPSSQGRRCGRGNWGRVGRRLRRNLVGKSPLVRSQRQSDGLWSSWKVTDRTAASRADGSLVAAAARSVAGDRQDEYYWADLIGLDVGEWTRRALGVGEGQRSSPHQRPRVLVVVATVTRKGCCPSSAPSYSMWMLPEGHPR